MTPEQIETMRRIQRGEGIAVYSDVCLLPGWTWRAAPLSGAVTLTEAGAEVLRLWAERETALCAQHDRFEGLLAAALGDPPIVDLDGDEPDLPDLESLIKAVERMRFALAAERAAHAEALLVLAAEQERQEGAPDPAWSWSSGNPGSPGFWSRSYPNGDYSFVRRMSDGRAEWDRTHDHSTKKEIERPVCTVGRAPNFHAAMLAADKATP